jgi:nitroimidazol reductase NimA-like FMN-containing flavoprotein (pyridoxamine 5'-phosphate oxidase superfamily)
MGTIFVLPDDRIEELLRAAIVGRIACCDHGADGRDGRPYLVPLAYGYDGEALYAHSGIGRKIRIMRANPLVTIEVDEAAASDRWSSVIAEGIYEEILEPAERERAFRIIYRAPATIPNLSPETVVFRIRLTAKSGRYEIPD